MSLARRLEKSAYCLLMACVCGVLLMALIGLAMIILKMLGMP